jgi:hyperosmotically inducible protein
MRKQTLIVATVTLGGLLLVSPTAPAQTNDKMSSPANHMDPWTRGPANESDLIQKIRHNILMLPYYGVFDDLGFQVNGGAVTLLGEVTRPTLKSDAENAIKKIAGVTSVDNKIEVLPLSPNDDAIRFATYRAIYGDPTLSTRYAYSATPAIHIIVKNGNVRLEGVVMNQMDKTLAGIRANGVSGVFSVQNDLKLDSNGGA